MPGELPDSSAYTYAVEFSVDEAVEAGATDVKFTKPVTTYVDNFLGFKAGTIVPSAYYDEGKGAWVPSKNGVVIKIVTESDGRANVDTDGDGTADNTGLDDAERSKLAQQYDAGKSLWRVEVEHFTPWDYNWPYGCRAQCDAPDEEPPPPPFAPSARPPARSSASSTRRSARSCPSPAPRSTSTTARPACPATRRPTGSRSRSPARSIRPSLRRVELEVTVAGREFRQTFQPQANLKHTFEWDGKDAYGREVVGAQNAEVRIGYVYPAEYLEPAEFEASFGQFGGAAGDPQRDRLHRGVAARDHRLAGVGPARGDARRRRGRARRLDAGRPPRLRPAVAHALPRRRLAGHDRGDPLRDRHRGRRLQRRRVGPEPARERSSRSRPRAAPTPAPTAAIYVAETERRPRR